METLSAIIFRMMAYVSFGICTEVIFTGLSKFFKWVWRQIKRIARGQQPDPTIPEEVKKADGNISLWMIFVYGILLVAVYEPVYHLMMYFNVHFSIRYIVWGISIASIEAFCGWIFFKFFKLMPWDYSNCRDKVFENGYTRWSYVPLWGFAGLALEVYYQIISRLSTQIYSIVKLVTF